MAIGDRKRFSSNNIDLCRLNLNFFFYFLPPLLQPSGRAYKYLWPAIYLWRDHTVHSRALCAHGFFVLDDGIAVFGLSDARKFQKLKTTSTFVFILKSKFRAKKKTNSFLLHSPEHSKTWILSLRFQVEILPTGYSVRESEEMSGEQLA